MVSEGIFFFKYRAEVGKVLLSRYTGRCKQHIPANIQANIGLLLLRKEGVLPEPESGDKNKQANGGSSFHDKFLGSDSYLLIIRIIHSDRLHQIFNWTFVTPKRDRLNTGPFLGRAP